MHGIFLVIGHFPLLLTTDVDAVGIVVVVDVVVVKVVVVVVVAVVVVPVVVLAE